REDQPDRQQSSRGSKMKPVATHALRSSGGRFFLAHRTPRNILALRSSEGVSIGRPVDSKTNTQPCWHWDCKVRQPGPAESPATGGMREFHDNGDQRARD